MQPSPRHPPTRVRCDVSAPREMKRGGHSFVNATPRHVNTLPPHSLPTFLSLCYLFYCIVSKKIKPHTVFALKIKRKGRAMLVWYKAWCYIVLLPTPTPASDYSLCSRGKMLEASPWDLLFPHLPTAGCESGGLALECLWLLDERGRGLIGLFCPTGHKHSGGPIYWLQPLHVRHSDVLPTLSVLWIDSCSTAEFIFWTDAFYDKALG